VKHLQSGGKPNQLSQSVAMSTYFDIGSLANPRNQITTTGVEH